MKFILRNAKDDVSKADKREYIEFISALKSIETIEYTTVDNGRYDHFIIVVKLCENKNSEKFVLREKIYVETGFRLDPVELWVDCIFFDLESDDKPYIKKMAESLLDLECKDYDGQKKYLYSYSLEPCGIHNDESILEYVSEHESKYGPIHVNWY